MDREQQEGGRSMKMNHRLTAVLLAVLLFLTGCGEANIPDSDPAREINYYILVSPNNLDPQTTFYVENMDVISGFTEGLMKMNENGMVAPGIAERYEVSDDGLTYTFYLREDAGWSNGTPVTADDFVFAWQRLIMPSTASDAAFLLLDCMDIVGADEIFYGGAHESSLGIKAVNNHILEIKLEHPCPFFLGLLTNVCLAPCNRAYYYENISDYGKKADAIISCGPYTVDYYEPLCMQVHLKKNEYYYDADEVMVPGVNVQVLNDVQQLIMSFESGEADVIPISGEQQEVSQGDPRLLTTPASAICYLLVNHDNKLLDNSNILKALSLCVNREMIQKNLLKEGYIPITRIVPPGFFYEPDGTDFGGDQDRYSSICGFEPELAKQYWEKGLKELGIDEITVEFLSVSTGNVIMDILKNDWEENLPGFTLKYRSVPLKAYLQELRDGHYDIVMYNWGADYADPTAYFNLFISNAPQNFGKFNSPELDRILHECNNNPLAGDPVGRAEKLHEAEDLLMNEMAILPLFAQGNAELVSNDVSGIAFYSITPRVSFRYAVKEGR